MKDDRIPIGDGWPLQRTFLMKTGARDTMGATDDQPNTLVVLLLLMLMTNVIIFVSIVKAVALQCGVFVVQSRCLPRRDHTTRERAWFPEVGNLSIHLNTAAPSGDEVDREMLPTTDTLGVFYRNQHPLRRAMSFDSSFVI